MEVCWCDDWPSLYHSMKPHLHRAQRLLVCFFFFCKKRAVVWGFSFETSMVWVHFWLLTAPVEDNNVVSLLHGTLHSLLPLAFVSLKTTEFKFTSWRLISVCSPLSLFAAQRKGTDEISSAAECPNSAGLPQTETGRNMDGMDTSDGLSADVKDTGCVSLLYSSCVTVQDANRHLFNL